MARRNIYIEETTPSEKFAGMPGAKAFVGRFRDGNDGRTLLVVKPEATSEQLPPLSAVAAEVYEMLLALPEHRAMMGPAILRALDQKNMTIDQSTLTGRIMPELKPYGVKNHKRIGYRIQPHRRKKS